MILQTFINDVDSQEFVVMTGGSKNWLVTTTPNQLQFLTTTS